MFPCEELSDNNAKQYLAHGKKHLGIRSRYRDVPMLVSMNLANSEQVSHIYVACKATAIYKALFLRIKYCS